MRKPPFTRTIAIAAALAGLFVAALFVLEPLNALRGWLTAFVWATAVPVGALYLLLIHRITGGRWGDALIPLLEPAARAVLPAVLIGLPVLWFASWIFPWSSPDMPANVARLYMNPALFGLRGAGALGIWSVLAWCPPLRLTPVRAAGALIVLMIITNIVPVDWIVSTLPGFSSSALGFGFGIEQIFAALGFCAVAAGHKIDKRQSRDLAGLLIAALLGVVYFVYMQFAIIWYGNLPQSTAWYQLRSIWPWPLVGALAFAAGALFPFAALLGAHTREDGRRLAILGANILFAIAIHLIWMIAPSFGAPVFLPSLLSVLFVSLLFMLWITHPKTRASIPPSRNNDLAAGHA